MNYGIGLTMCEVLFALPTYNNLDLKLTNFLIFIDKGVWNKGKSQNRPFYFLDYITLIKDKIEILKHISAINNEEAESWAVI